MKLFNKWQSLQDFNKYFFPILLSFAGGRLLLQTDLIFVASLGTDEAAAFGIPLKVMILDMIVAFAMAPAVSVLVAEARRKNQGPEVVTQAINLAWVLGFILGAIGLFVYPLLVSGMNVSPHINDLAQDAVFWLTLCIPLKMVGFTSNMVLHAFAKGRIVTRINIVALIINVGLDYLLMFPMNLGFKGAYIASFFVSGAMGLSSLIFVVRSPEIKGLYKFSQPDWLWSKKLFQMTSSEALRISSERGLGVILIYVAAGFGSPTFLAVYAIASEFLSLAMMPGIAAMRSMAIYLQKCDGLPSMKKEIFQIGGLHFPFVVSAMIALVFTRELIGSNLYNLSHDSLAWWNLFVLVFAITLPIQYFDHLIRAIFHARKQFSNVTKIDVLSSWIFVLPLFSLALWANMPWLVWMALLGESVVSLPYLLNLTNKQERSPSP